MPERLKHKNVRAKTAQEILDSNNIEAVLANYYSRYPSIEINPDLDPYNLGDANDEIAMEYNKTLRAHFIEMGAFASLLSYELIDSNRGALSRFTSLLECGDLKSSLLEYVGNADEMYLLHKPFPLPVRQYAACIGNMHTKCKEATVDQQRTYEKQYLHVKVDVLHRRLRRLYECLKNSPYAESITIPRRLLGFDPKDRGYTNSQEIALLKSRQAYIDAAIPFEGNNKSDEVVGCLSAETLFAASYAIEERYPGIDSRDVTRLLLKNIVELSEVARQGTSNKLYHSIVRPFPDDPTAQGTFSAFMRGVTVTEKMVLDDQDRLHIPVIAGNGKCPLGFIYEGSKERVAHAHSFYESIESKYGVGIPRSPYVDLAAEHMAMSIVAAEYFINGRTHKIIDDFKATLLGQVVSKVGPHNSDP